MWLIVKPRKKKAETQWSKFCKNKKHFWKPLCIWHPTSKCPGKKQDELGAESFETADAQLGWKETFKNNQIQNWPTALKLENK